MNKKENFNKEENIKNNIENNKNEENIKRKDKNLDIQETEKYNLEDINKNINIKEENNDKDEDISKELSEENLNENNFKKEDTNKKENVNKDIPKDKKNKKKKIFTFILVLLVIYIGGGLLFNNLTYPLTKVNGESMAFKPLDDIYKDIDLGQITINGREGKKDILNPEEAGMTAEYVDDIVISQNGFLWPIEIFKEHKYENSVMKDVANESLKEWIENSDLNKDITNPQNAQIIKENGEYKIVDEILGDKLDIDKTVETLSKAFTEGNHNVDLEEEYINPEITKLDLIKKVELLNKLEDVTISIDFGKDRVEKLDNLIQFFNDENFELQESKLKDYVNELKKKYDNVGKAREFITSSGENIIVSGGIYGVSIDRNKTASVLKEKILEGKDASIEPIYSSKSQNFGEIGDTYVEISIADQHMWFYKNGNLIVDTPVVTGTADGKYDTPKGIYSAWLKQKDRYLEGPNGDGTRYKVHVDYWIQVDFTGIGIHDTYYRSAYGGDIYKTGGSHGCINTPHEKVKKLYDNLEKGTPVIIY